MTTQRQLTNLIFVIFILLSVPSCITVSRKSQVITSGKHMEDSVKKIFALIDLPQDMNYAAKFEYQLQEQLASKGIPAIAYKKEKMDLNSDQDIAKMIADYSPTHVITIGVESVFNGDVIKDTRFRLTLVNVSSEKVVWEGALLQSLGTIRKPSQAENDVKAIIDELVNQNLIK